MDILWEEEVKMATLLKGIPSAGAACVIMVLAGCGGEDTPTDPLVSGMLGGLVGTQSVSGLPGWIVNPSTLPPGRVGKNNCTFGFGDNVPIWDFHPDAGCWEHAGPDGWTRQQTQRIHFASFPSACGGGPGDATGIRVCRAGGVGQPSPCSLDTTIGPSGCARCVINPTCH